MAGKETINCSVEDCNFPQDGKCFIVKKAGELAEKGIYTDKDWGITIQHLYDLIEEKGCAGGFASKNELQDITPKNVVESKEKING